MCSNAAKQDYNEKKDGGAAEMRQASNVKTRKMPAKNVKPTFLFASVVEA